MNYFIFKTLLQQPGRIQGQPGAGATPPLRSAAGAGRSRPRTVA
jgi:hypothetical protein